MPNEKPTLSTPPPQVQGEMKPSMVNGFPNTSFCAAERPPGI